MPDPEIVSASPTRKKPPEDDTQSIHFSDPCKRSICFSGFINSKTTHLMEDAASPTRKKLGQEHTGAVDSKNLLQQWSASPTRKKDDECEQKKDCNNMSLALSTENSPGISSVLSELLELAGPAMFGSYNTSINTGDNCTINVMQTAGQTERAEVTGASTEDFDVSVDPPLIGRPPGHRGQR